MGSLSSSAASVPLTSTPPRHQKRPLIPHAMTITKTHIATAVKDTKKKKVRPNTSSKPISRRQEDPHPPLNPTPNPLPNPLLLGFQDRESVHLLYIEFNYYYTTQRDMEYEPRLLTPYEFRIISKLIRPSF